MNKENSMAARLTIDLKRYRFRLHKKTLRLLGHPNYIQFIINTEELCIVILGSDKPIPGGTANRIVVDFSIKDREEFCNSTLQAEIVKIYGGLDFQYSYRLSGEIDETNRVAYFYLNTLKKIERRPTDDRKGI